MNDILAVVKKCKVVHVAMIDDGMPYVVALNFGFDRRGDGTLVLYVHSAREGRKITALKKNPSVYFQMDCVNELKKGTAENPCSYSWRFDSVAGSGIVSFIDDMHERQYALNRIIAHLDADAVLSEFDFPPHVLEKTCVWKIEARDISGKHSG